VRPHDAAEPTARKAAASICAHTRLHAARSKKTAIPGIPDHINVHASLVSDHRPQKKGEFLDRSRDLCLSLRNIKHAAQGAAPIMSQRHSLGPCRSLCPPTLAALRTPHACAIAHTPHKQAEQARTAKKPHNASNSQTQVSLATYLLTARRPAHTTPSKQVQVTIAEQPAQESMQLPPKEHTQLPAVR
jgi:hypothetical protein